MKKFLYIMVPALLLAASCDKVYEERWDSLYYVDEYGDKVLRMNSTYKLTNDSTSSYQDIPFSQPIAVYYSGSWTASLVGECNWGFIDKTAGEGVHYLHFNYLQNTSGADRYVILRLSCDNGETADITLTQASL